MLRLLKGTRVKAVGKFFIDWSSEVDDGSADGEYWIDPGCKQEHEDQLPEVGYIFAFMPEFEKCDQQTDEGVRDAAAKVIDADTHNEDEKQGACIYEAVDIVF